MKQIAERIRIIEEIARKAIAEEADSAIHEVADGITRTSELVQEIGTASNEQNSSIVQIEVAPLVKTTQRGSLATSCLTRAAA